MPRYDNVAHALVRAASRLVSTLACDLYHFRGKCRDESRHGTHECVRYGLSPYFGAAGAFSILAVLLLAGTTATTVRFVDIAAEAGLTIPNTFGGKEKKNFILESTGTGAAIFDYDGDGANDIFIANGTTLDPHAPPTRSQLYHNDGKGHFTEVCRQAGLSRSGCGPTP